METFVKYFSENKEANPTGFARKGLAAYVDFAKICKGVRKAPDTVTTIILYQCDKEDDLHDAEWVIRKSDDSWSFDTKCNDAFTLANGKSVTINSECGDKSNFELCLMAQDAHLTVDMECLTNEELRWAGEISRLAELD